MKRFLCIAFCAAVICSAPFAYKFIGHGSMPFSVAGWEKSSRGEAINGHGTRKSLHGSRGYFARTDAEDIDEENDVGGGSVANLRSSVTKLCVGAAILLLLWGSVNVMRRRRYDRSGEDGRSAIQIVSKLSLGQKHYLAVVSCEQKRFLIGITQNGIGRIGTLGEGPLRTVQKSASTEGKIA